MVGDFVHLKTVLGRVARGCSQSDKKIKSNYIPPSPGPRLLIPKGILIWSTGRPIGLLITIRSCHLSTMKPTSLTSFLYSFLSQSCIIILGWPGVTWKFGRDAPAPRCQEPVVHDPLAHTHPRPAVVCTGDRPSTTYCSQSSRSLFPL